jgi:hypothetical protein
MQLGIVGIISIFVPCIVALFVNHLLNFKNNKFRRFKKIFFLFFEFCVGDFLFCLVIFFVRNGLIGLEDDIIGSKDYIDMFFRIFYYYIRGLYLSTVEVMRYTIFVMRFYSQIL